MVTDSSVPIWARFINKTSQDKMVTTATHTLLSSKTSYFSKIMYTVVIWYKPKLGKSMLGTCCSVTKSCPTLCDLMDCSSPGFPVLHCLLAFAQTHAHWVSDAIQPSHPLSSSPPACNLSQHQSLLKWVRAWHQVAKELELQLQPQSFQWIFRVDFL